MSTSTFVGCEFDPDRSEAAIDGDHHNATVQATVIVGAGRRISGGNWMLCADCASLPRFKRFRTRKAITRDAEGWVEVG